MLHKDDIVRLSHMLEAAMDAVLGFVSGENYIVVRIA